MIDYSKFFGNSTELRTLMKGLDELSGPILLYGSDYLVYSFLADAIRDLYSRDVLLYFEDDMKARSAHQMIAGSEYISPTDIVFGQAFSQSDAGGGEKQETLLRLSQRVRTPVVVTASIVCALDKFPSVEDEHQSYELVVGEHIKLSDFFNFLYDNGYEKVSYVSQKFEVSVRGGIIDVFSPLHDMPLRIELFGDEIVSIRRFDLATQSSVEKIPVCTVYAGGGHQKNAANESALEDYLQSPVVMIIGANSGMERIRHSEEEFLMRTTDYFLRNEELSMSALLQLEGIAPRGEGADGIVSVFKFRADEVVERLKKSRLVVTEMLQKTVCDFEFSQIIQLSAKDVYGDLGVITSEINRLQHAGYCVYVSFFTENRLGRYIEFLTDHDYDAPFTIVRDSQSDLKRDLSGGAGNPAQSGQGASKIGMMYLVLSSIEKSMVFPTFKSAIITETELFAPKKKKVRTKSSVSGIKAYSELNAGDYVVHDSYGIGIFAGIQQILTDGVRRDYLRINYAGSDVLYVPVESSATIRKYIGADTEKVKISKMGSITWKNQVSRAKKSVEEMADDLIELYAKRQSKIGFAFSPDTAWQQEFEDLFPYEETPDQTKATEEIKRDMESNTPMDRLLSGDVGYGKTEVALRAAFKAVSNSKQVAVLVPTTVLAQQHYNNIKERFSKYPVRVDMVSRFRSAAEIKKTLASLKSGEVDILVGTHRILSKDVKFKDLGLLIVDEEQRFGVKHKEAIKLVKETVDVLTLTATPIPRTLHMSILGVRDMSVLEDPPAERSPVQTYVMEYSASMVREAILREVERGGQVYYVYNRIEGIERIAAELQEMMPDISVRTAHGRMGEGALEKIMLDFMEGRFDVLVSTTIIETGLDISNVNTMIVRGADMLGLSQLYQLRGRVGRSARRGYCYAFFQRGKQLTEVQERRLRAIREFTDLGAGFKIAMKDLEIRGAGNLLGTAQSGFMESIGYDMFLRILDETLRRRKGEHSEEREDTRIEFKVSAYISDEYVADSQTRIDMYKQISALEGRGDELLRLFEDKYGPAPTALKNLLCIAEMKYYCEMMGISLVRESGNQVFLRFSENHKMDFFKMGAMLNDCKFVTYVTGESEELRIDKPDEANWISDIARKIETVYNYLM